MVSIFYELVKPQKIGEDQRVDDLFFQIGGSTTNFCSCGACKTLEYGNDFGAIN